MANWFESVIGFAFGAVVTFWLSDVFKTSSDTVQASIVIGGAVLVGLVVSAKILAKAIDGLTSTISDERGNG